MTREYRCTYVSQRETLTSSSSQPASSSSQSASSSSQSTFSSCQSASSSSQLASSSQPASPYCTSTPRSPTSRSEFTLSPLSFCRFPRLLFCFSSSFSSGLSFLKGLSSGGCTSLFFSCYRCCILSHKRLCQHP